MELKVLDKKCRQSKHELVINERRTVPKRGVNNVLTVKVSGFVCHLSTGESRETTQCSISPTFLCYSQRDSGVPSVKPTASYATNLQRVSSLAELNLDLELERACSKVECSLSLQKTRVSEARAPSPSSFSPLSRAGTDGASPTLEGRQRKTEVVQIHHPSELPSGGADALLDVVRTVEE
ncbi:hypothetical protein MHYP_G00020420 [Metynnis hypsauchen]